MLHAQEASGLAALAQLANNNFNVKVYTQEMLDAINNPTANLAKTAEAYQYFTAMYKGQNFTTADGQSLNFANLPDSVKKALHDQVTTVLKDYSPINVPYDSKGDTTPLLNADGSQASLLDLIANPTASFHVDFKIDQGDVEDNGDGSSSDANSPAWANKMDSDYANEDNHWYGSANGWGGTDHFGVGDRSAYTLTASVSEGACSSTLNWDISGTAADWEKSGALNPVANSNAAGDASSLENYLQNNM